MKSDSESVTTSMAAMQLAEKGVIDIDQPLQYYLPQFSMKNRFPHEVPVTPRAIMIRHARLPSTLLRGMWGPSAESESFNQVVEQIRNIDLALPPGLIHFYQNLGMTLLGHMVQVVDGRPYETYIADEIFKPLRVNPLLVSGGRIANRDNRSAASNGEFGLRNLGYDS